MWSIVGNQSAITVNADVGGKLTIESLQDQITQSSSQDSLGARVQFGFGTAWEVSGCPSQANANANGGSSPPVSG